MQHLSEISQLPVELQEKVKKALNDIYHAIDLYSPEGLAFSFNGGKDCTALLHLLYLAFTDLKRQNKEKNSNRNTTPQFLTIFFKPQSVFKEIDEFVEKTINGYDLNMRVIPHNFKEGLKELLQTTKVKAIFLGTRRTDPKCEHGTIFMMTDEGWPQVMRISPLLDWNYHDIWEFLLRFNVPYCSLYDQGYTSLGNMTSTKPNPVLKQEDGSYHPAFKLQDTTKERDGR